MLQFGQKSVESKDFYRTKKITNISTLDHDKIVVSNSIPCNKGKDQRYVVRYEDGDKIVASLHQDTSKGVQLWSFSVLRKLCLENGV